MCGEFVKCCISGSTNCVELKQNSRAKFKRQNAEDDRDNLPPPVPTKADEPGAQVPTEVQSKDKGNTSVVSEHEDLEITEPEITEPEITGSETEEDEVLESVSTDDPKPTQEPKSSTNLTSPDSTSSPDPNTPLSPGIPT